MFSKTGKPGLRSAAWRISFWATLAFAFGTMVVFVFLQQFVSREFQRRSDAWLSGEAGVLSDVAGRTPKDRLYNRVVGEVAELASREVSNRPLSNPGQDESVFFLQTAPDGSLALWVGAGDSTPYLAAIRRSVISEKPSHLRVAGFPIPFRVTSVGVNNGRHVYLGLSEKDELHLLRNLRIRFVLLWLSIVLIGAAIVFLVTRRMLGHVRRITEAASRIGETDLSGRVPVTSRNDEVAQLALTLNNMLDRIESSVHQLHTITDSLAHDIRSPLTALRAKLEMSLTSGSGREDDDAVVSSIEELDRLTEFLDKSLDVAEAKAEALRLNRTPIDLDDLLRTMVDLYEPSMTEKGLVIKLQSAGSFETLGDAALMHRMVANLFDNELKHLRASSTVTICLREKDGYVLLTLEDDGSGFDDEVSEHVFERRVKGPKSSGHGLGLAFVDAVVRAHGGTVEASNRPQGGASLSIMIPLLSATRPEAPGISVLTC